jgi:uncharacterized protein (TIGR03067 family)
MHAPDEADRPATTRRRLLAIASSTLAVVALPGCVGSARVRHPIEGTWFVTSATLAGEVLPLSSFDGEVLDLDAGHYTFQKDRGEYVVLPGTQPSAIDIHGQDGPNAGRTILAIFLLAGNTLTIAYDLSGTARPARFESTAGTRQFLVRYQRAS